MVTDHNSEASSLKVSLKTFTILSVKCKEEDACSIIFGTKHNGFARQTCSYCSKVQSFIFAYASRVAHTYMHMIQVKQQKGCIIAATLLSSSFPTPYHLSSLSLFSQPNKIPGTDPRTCKVIYNENRPEKAAFVMS